MSDAQDTPASRCSRARHRCWERNVESPNAFTLLTLLFVALKLTGHIDWSWWWVLSPVWLVLAFVAAGLLAVFLWETFTGKKRKPRPG